eukprot:EC790984.1.p2 GENE.EC790984.1~~EC790984.1.p2  ORF type:complete len:162 (+),score=53.89 EC790984.1:36-488(+)
MGLTSAPIHRLKKMKAMVSKRKQEMVSALEDLSSFDANNGKLRAAVKAAFPPSIPFVGSFLTLLVHLDENVPFVGDTKMVNFFKYKKIAAIIKEVAFYQQTPYAITPVPYLLHWLTNMPVLSEIEQDKASLRCEPREVKPPPGATSPTGK